MGHDATKINWVCYQGVCFTPPEDLSADLARQLDTDRNGVITDQAGTGLGAGRQVLMGPVDVTAANRDTYENLIFDHYYTELPVNLQGGLQVRVEPSYAAKVSRPVAEIKTEVRAALAKARPRIEEVLGHKISDDDWTDIPVLVRLRRTRGEEKYAGFARNRYGEKRVEVDLLDEGDGITVHEMAHAILFKLAMRRGFHLGKSEAQYPSWFSEGFAHFAESPYFRSTERRFSLSAEQMMTRDGFENFRYDNGHESTELMDRAEAFLAIKYLVNQYGLEKLRRLVARIVSMDRQFAKQPFAASFEETVGIPFSRFASAANTWIKDQLPYKRITDEGGHLLAEEFSVEGRPVWRKNYNIFGKPVSREVFEYDEKGRMRFKRIYDVSDRLTYQEQYREGDLESVIIIHPDGKMEDRWWVLAPGVRGVARQIVDDKVSRVRTDTVYENVVSLADISLGRPLDKAHYELPGRPSASGGGYSLFWHTWENLEYRDSVVVRRVISYDEKAKEKPFRLNEVVLSSGDMTVKLVFYPEPRRWRDVFMEADDPRNHLRRDNLSGGRLKSITILRGETPVYGETYVERNLLHLAASMGRNGQIPFWEIERKGEKRTITVKREDGSPLLRLTLTQRSARFTY